MGCYWDDKTNEAVAAEHNVDKIEEDYTIVDIAVEDEEVYKVGMKA